MTETPSATYQALQDSLAQGWNTWNTRSVLSHVLLPEGIALNLGLPVVIAPTLASNDAPTSRVIVTYTDEGEWLGPRRQRPG